MLSIWFLVSSKRLYDIHVTWFDWFLLREGDIKRIGHSCFHNRWPNSKTKLKWKHIWEQGCFRGPAQLAFSKYREDRLCMCLQCIYVFIYFQTLQAWKTLDQKFLKITRNVNSVEFQPFGRAALWLHHLYCLAHINVCDKLHLALRLLLQMSQRLLFLHCTIMSRKIFGSR